MIILLKITINMNMKHFKLEINCVLCKPENYNNEWKNVAAV